MSVLVFGSINMDLVARTPHLPKPGETLIGDSFETVPGGKGANQAVAVARLGVPVDLVGRVGQDAFGETLLQGLRMDGVGCDRIHRDAHAHSGVAIIAVDQAGENHIIVIAGANARVGDADLARLQVDLPATQVLLLQLEIPLDPVIQAATVAHGAGVIVILDPAPAADLPDRLYPQVDILTPNQVEAAQLVGFPVDDWASAEAAGMHLRQKGAGTVIIKLGALGALCVTAEGSFQIPPFPVQAIDTVAAGDAFNGGLAAALATGLPLPEATRQAAAVAALAVTQAGAQPSLPNRTALEQFLAQFPAWG